MMAPLRRCLLCFRDTGTQGETTLKCSKKALKDQLGRPKQVFDVPRITTGGDATGGDTGGSGYSLSETLPDGPLLDTSSLRSFTDEEIRKATRNLSVKIGEGGFGAVYKGMIKTSPTAQTYVAVKKLSSRSRQGLPELIKEIEVLPRLHHKHLVRLIGYCNEESCQALVYEYINNGNLRDHLHGKRSEVPLPWIRRLSIALDIAHAIDYLHVHVSPSVIHRDIKAANILLDDRFHAKLSDFGLSKLLAEDDEFTHITTDVRGTAGYLDPEYYQTRRLTDKSDIHSFGVVILELISGRRSVEFTGKSHFNLVKWAKSELAKGNIRQVLDSRIPDGSYNVNALWRLADIAIRCCATTSADRPSIGQVVRCIQEAKGDEMRTPVVQEAPDKPPSDDEDNVFTFRCDSMDDQPQAR
ncbi:hypothetical protein CBR_g21978 [Chara braunii]|uniref:Protein kinase domain-containing protein n=1 Tax=Chara braunii TaxID=69332 RepID=A0A388L1P0_CHABU|nr:hypothetical protein CBR_g21978 [Chara braunii]|eukprot:GBG76230.1 hypothetical protein CBR_g21978 [Chara braunii]